MSLKANSCVATYEHGKTTEGEPYLVMEWIDGLGLNYLIETKSPQLKGNRVNFLRQLCDAVPSPPFAQVSASRSLSENVRVTKEGTVKLIRFRADDSLHAGLLSTGESDRAADYLALRDHQATNDRPPSRHLRLGSDGLRNLYRRVALGALAVERGNLTQAPEHAAARPKGLEPGPGRRYLRHPPQGDHTRPNGPICLGNGFQRRAGQPWSRRLLKRMCGRRRPSWVDFLGVRPSCRQPNCRERYRACLGATR